MKQFNLNQIKFQPTRRQIIVGGVAIVLFLGSLLLTYFFVTTLKIFEGTLPGFALDSPNPASTQAPGLPAAEPTVAAPAGDLPPQWDGASRVTMLVMGLDYGDWSADRNGPSRTDTMILLTVDPQTKTGAMLSIPRDLWVDIPGYGYNKINTAYYLGELNKLPGGGPALAVKTVEEFLGVPIQYYAQVDFYTFINFIDQIGGIDINVPYKIRLDPLGPGNVFILPAGMHHLDGMKALAYARDRHTANGDIDRADRQQQVIFAIRDKVLDPTTYPKLLASAPYLYGTIQGGVRTNLDLQDAIKLIVLANEIPRENIQHAVIDFTMMTQSSVVQSGQTLAVLNPIPDKIRELRDSLFATGIAASPEAKGNLPDLVKQENPSITILNGSYASGIAGKTGDYLKSLGFNVVNEGNAPQASSVTRITIYRGLPYSLQYFKNLFNFTSSSQIINQFDPNAQVDIVITLGQDWATKNPMP